MAFAGEQRSRGSEAVAEGVHGGYRFAFGRLGTTGFGAVEAGAFEFSLRCRFGHSLTSGFKVAGGQAFFGVGVCKLLQIKEIDLKINCTGQERFGEFWTFLDAAARWRISLRVETMKVASSGKKRPPTFFGLR